MLTEPARDFAAAFTAIADLKDKAEDGKITSDDINGFPTGPVADMALGILNLNRRDYLRGVAIASQAAAVPAAVPVAPAEPDPVKAPKKKAAKKGK